VDRIRGLGLTCAVLAVAGLVSLATMPQRETTRAAHRAGTLLAGVEVGGASGSPDAEPLPLPLFPTTTSTRPGKGSTSSVLGAVAASATSTRGIEPAFGSFRYGVQGTEALTGFGTRKLPTTMTLTVARGSTANDVVIDAAIGADHTEHEALSTRSDLIGLQSATITAVFGPVTRTTAGTYDGPVGRVALPAAASATRSGASVVKDADGTTLRTEDWKVTDVASQSMTVGGAVATVWEVTLTRTSRPGATEALTETRRAWFDPARRLFLKWETHLHTERGVQAYDLDYTATITALP
jgi:hypothetical protein